MWFKQIQLFQLSNPLNFQIDKLMSLLEPLAFIPCLPSMPHSSGWVAPIEDDNDEKLIRSFNGYAMLCFQVEEKILPAAVIRQELNDAIKELEVSGNRKLRQKEKFTLKDDITNTLLPRAFSRFTRVYAYIDTKNAWLILGTTNNKIIELFISAFKKSVSDNIQLIHIQNLSSLMTNWLSTQRYPTEFSVEKSCVLQDPNQENRIIRCQQQDLFATSIQSLLKDGCAVKQLSLCWQDRVNFALTDDFFIRTIQYQDEIKEQIKEIGAETKQQRFDADFLIMTATLSNLLVDLVNAFTTDNVIPLTKSA
jgi:recombination associated protein RdgC